MASIFRKFKKKLPKVTSKSSAYYERENSLPDLADLKKALEGASDLKGLVSKTEFTFNALPLAKITSQLIKSKYGSPNYTLSNSESIDGHKVMFYKQSVQYYKFLIQYHFIDNQFFFASNKISSLAVLSDEDKQKVVNRLSKKYLDLNYSDIKSLSVKLIDPNNSIIYTRDDVYFHINYLAGNDKTNQLIKEYADYIVQENKTPGFNESLEQLI